VKPDQIELYYGSVIDTTESDKLDWALLDEAERVKVRNIKNVLLQTRYLFIHARLRQLLGIKLKLAPEKIVIARTSFGKPFLPENPDLVFNLSHSDDKFLIALARNCWLGVDIEKVKTRVDFSGLVSKCFAEEEKYHWHKLPKAEKETEFYRFWTRKEAFVKAVGRGLATGLGQCVINPQYQTEFLRIPDEFGPALRWRASSIEVDKYFCASVVTDKRNAEIKQFDLSTCLNAITR
jgi:4'-phosphopantetheinyl transferase